MPTVLVVDDAPLFRVGLTAALSDEGFDVLEPAGDGMAALDSVRRHHPDLVVLDLLMPGMSGLEVLRPILRNSPETRVLCLTSSESEEDLLSAIKGGARGYLVKDMAMPELVRGVRQVLHGGAVVSPAMGEKLFDTVASLLRHRETVAARKPELTGREIEILQHVADGMTSKEIGERLFISENTVKNHVRNILDKLGLHSRNEAVMYALREDLITNA